MTEVRSALLLLDFYFFFGYFNTWEQIVQTLQGHSYCFPLLIHYMVLHAFLLLMWCYWKANIRIYCILFLFILSYQLPFKMFSIIRETDALTGRLA